MLRAEQDTTKPKKKHYFFRTLDIDRPIVSRLKLRLTLAKKLAYATAAKEKKHSENDWMGGAVEKLGVDYDSETFETEAKGKKGRGSGRKRKEKEVRQLTKAEMGALRAELKAVLNERINVGRLMWRRSWRVRNLEFWGDAGALRFDEK